MRQRLQETGREPESYIFVGDTGELDKECGMRMLTDRDCHGKMCAIFLHVVSSDDEPVVPPDSFINGKPIIFFRTYVGAALKAASYGFISFVEAKEVISQAWSDLRRRDVDSLDDAHLPSKWKDMKKDLATAVLLYPDEFGSLELSLAQQNIGRVPNGAQAEGSNGL